MTRSIGPLGDVSRKLTVFRRALEGAEAPEEVIRIGAGVAGIEALMQKSGFYRIEEMRPVRELFLDSRCELGAMLRKMLRGTGPGRGKKIPQAAESFLAYLKRLGLQWDRANEAQRASTLPKPERVKAYREAKEAERPSLPTMELLIDLARPYWYAESRKLKHRSIAAKAAENQIDGNVGPFPLIYADPPWKFQTYSEKGLDRTPDQHYPTLTDQQICDFQIGGKRISEIAAKDAALFLWCTSSNIRRAFAIMDAWGFDYSTQAIWVKTKADGSILTGLGLVFRNAHEVLLYGTRGNMPGPQYQPPSVFLCERGKHSAKPDHIRSEIEKMYPDFDEQTRLELFARQGSVPAWSCHGLEAISDAAE